MLQEQIKSIGGTVDMHEKIMIIINNWDPINLFPMAPEDEYNSEIIKIMKFIYENTYTTSMQLGAQINRIFSDSYGIDVFTASYEKCLVIAEKILSQINK